jgi:hypothetical protein
MRSRRSNRCSHSIPKAEMRKVERWMRDDDNAITAFLS